MHWSWAYVGRRYVDGEFDCGELARLVQKEVFGKDVAIATERGYLKAEGTLAKFRAMSAQIAAELPSCCEPTTLPREGDGVLLVTRGHAQHVGVYCFIAREPWVLHASDSSRQVVLTRIRDLAVRGMRVEGYYRWI